MNRGEIVLTASRRELSGKALGGVWALAAAVTLAWMARLSPGSVVGPKERPHWWLMAVVFAVAQEVRSELHLSGPVAPVDLTDVVLVWALVSLPPPYVVFSCVAGATAYALARRKAPGETLLEAGRAAFAAGLATLVFLAAAGQGRALSAHHLLAAIGATILARAGVAAASLALPGIVAARFTAKDALGSLAASAVAASAGAGLAWRLGRAPQAAWAPAVLLGALSALWALSAVYARHRRIAALCQFSEDLRRCQGQGDLLGLLVTTATRLSGASRGLVGLKGPDGVTLARVAGSGAGGVELEEAASSDPALERLSAFGAAKGRLSRWARDSSLRRELGHWGAREVLVVPLDGGEGRPGALALFDKADAARSFSHADLRICRILANQVGIALHNRALTSELRAAVSQREQQARQDPLTGLLNRSAFLEAVKVALESGGEHIALAVIGVDDYQEVDEVLGHYYGDGLLSAIGTRLQSVSEGPAAHLEAGVFALCLGDVASPAVARQKGEHLRCTLGAQLGLKGGPIEGSVKVGLALASQHGRSAEILLRRARSALRQARQTEKAVCCCEGVPDPSLPRRLMIAHELRRALDSDGLIVHYQPIVALSDSSVVGTEALVRWPHPRYGLLPPEEFVPVAERSGLIRQLTRWVLGEAIRQGAAWRRVGFEAWSAVNVSAAAVADPALVPTIGELLSDAGLSASSLVLELTESAVLEDPAGAVAALESLAALGVTMALDDFGTGYSPLTYLSTMPVRILKIDKSFVSEMKESNSEAVIVRSTIALAAELGLEVVAEGIEDEASFARLRRLGATCGQGFHIAPPMPGSQVPAWAARRQDRAGAEARREAASPAAGRR